MSDEMIGRYKVLSEIGRGGMAVVYLAQDTSVNRKVAIKVLPRQFTFDPMFRERFRREAEVIATLEHPCIVPMYDFGEYDEQPFIVMRYMSGGSLVNHLHGGPLQMPEIQRIIDRVGSALDEAHANQIVHRDLKPGNILFDQRGDSYLSDFGIVKLGEANASLTGSGIIGTPAYMSPEQAQGVKDIDGRADLYALGIIFWEMLTGKPP
jgi:serine/threonine protein kinase